MSLPCALPASDTPPPRGLRLQAADSETTAGQPTAWPGVGEAQRSRGFYARRSSSATAFTLPVQIMAAGTLWIKEVRCRSLLRVASIHARFGRTVRALRAKAGYSQESFADATRIHRTSMGTLERGEGNPTLDTIVKIARGLDLSLSELFVAMEKDTGQHGA